jgi:hypothetical protein
VATLLVALIPLSLLALIPTVRRCFLSWLVPPRPVEPSAPRVKPPTGY